MVKLFHISFAQEYKHILPRCQAAFREHNKYSKTIFHTLPGDCSQQYLLAIFCALYGMLADKLFFIFKTCALLHA